MSDMFDAARPEVVFHLAAQIDVRHSVENPAADAQSNVLGTIAVLEARASQRRRRVVNTSTGGGLYGDADVLPTPEDYPIRPLAPYGQSKLAAEGYCELYTRLHGLSTVSLRYGNVYGPRQDVHGEAGVVAIFCGHLIEGPRRRCSATAARRATGSTSAMSCARTCSAADVRARRPDQHRPGPRDVGARPARRAARGQRAGDLAEPEFAPERPGEVRRSWFERDVRGAELGWARADRPSEGLRADLGGIGDRASVIRRVWADPCTRL